MSERLLSVGLDVGTTSTQLVVSELMIENKAGSFAVPEMEIENRKILYQSPVYFTPLAAESRVDGEKIREIVAGEYARAGIRREQVDTGAIIITGETSRKENARAVLSALSDYAGDFVVATAGPELESVLAAKGSGAVAFSEKTGKTVLHMDIGGGTGNLALIREGKIEKTGCPNVGGRLIKFEKNGKVTYVSPVLKGLCSLKVGDMAEEKQVAAVAEMLTQALEMAAGLRERTELLEKLWTMEIATPVCAMVRNDTEICISFSGGVAECIARDVPWLEFGDMGPVLGRAIRESRLCRGQYRIGADAIRATVIGAGCHSAQLSGSTIFCQNVELPLKNLPVVFPEAGLPLGAAIARAARSREEIPVIALPGLQAPGYAQVREMAEEIAGAGVEPLILCLEADMAKALGQALAVRLGKDAKILCIDRVRLRGEAYLDVGKAVGPALPVVVKTIVLAGRNAALHSGDTDCHTSVRTGSQ